MDSATFPSLLWTALGALERAYIDESAGVGPMPSLDQWANLLRAIGPGGTNLRELPAMVRLSKRAVRLRLSFAARHGFVDELQSGRGQSTVRLTVRGAGIVSRWRSLQDAAEKKWRARIGVRRVDKLRSCLEQVVAIMPLEHPHYPASYGAADASITGGNGKDWEGVPRNVGDTVSYLPLSALLSQALVNFAMSYEERSPVALSLTIAVIRRIPRDGRPMHGIGDSVGFSALRRHGFVGVTGAAGGEVILLTPKGAAVFDAYEQRLRAVETEWCSWFAPAQVDALRRALENVADAVHLRGERSVTTGTFSI